MSVPGPPGALWAVSLVLWAAGAVIVGEAVRGTAARWVTLWRGSEPIGRAILDLYLGGALLYLVAALELGAFVRPVVLALPVAASAVVVGRMVLLGRRHEVERAVGRWIAGLANPWVGIAVASTIGLYAIEVAAAAPIATGNTYDSSLLTTYVALLLQHGNLPLSFSPYATPAILYPQGTTVWLAWAQVDFGLPAARTALLVTPLFLGVAPLSGYVLGRQWLGTPRAGAAFAVAMAFLGPSTRALAGGSNDFAVAFPLVLLLAAQAAAWSGRQLPSLPDALGFGLLLGYSATINVVGAEWLLPALVVLGASSAPAFGGRSAGWWTRWGVTGAASLFAGIPSLYVLTRAVREPSGLAGAVSAPAGVSVGIGLPQFLGSIDPFLFRPGDIELSPIPFLRIELALLLVLGAAALLWQATQRPRAEPWAGFSRWVVAALVVLIAWLGVQLAAGVPGSPLRVLAFLSSAGEFSLWVFTVFGLVSAVPLVLAFDRLALPPPLPPGSASRGRATRPRGLARAFAPVAFAVVVVVPAAVLAPSGLGSVLHATYEDFGNVSAADFQLFAYAAGHLEPGTRVLVAPGSAGEFLPGYVRGIVLLYVMTPGWSRINGSYNLVVEELTNGTLDAAGRRALASLSVDLIVVTGNSSVIFPAFWASTLRDATVNASALFPVIWHEGDAWLFNASACRAGRPGCD